MYVDAHCHLERQTYGQELEAVIDRATRRGLLYFIAVGASGVAGGAREVVALSEDYPAIFASVGIHPHDAALAKPEDIDAIDALLGLPKVVSLGEVGLDYYYDNAPRDVQQAVFQRFLRMAKARNIPIMLHIRDAHEDCWRMLDEEGLPEAGGVVHCFTAGVAEAKEYLARGMYLSIPGVVTFKNAGGLRDAVRHMPLDRLLVETDCPYLAPVPHRGKRNEPAFVVDTATAVGELRDLSPLEVGELTCANARRLFRLPSLTLPPADAPAKA